MGGWASHGIGMLPLSPSSLEHCRSVPSPVRHPVLDGTVRCSVSFYRPFLARFFRSQRRNFLNPSPPFLVSVESQWLPSRGDDRRDKWTPASCRWDSTDGVMSYTSGTPVLHRWLPLLASLLRFWIISCYILIQQANLDRRLLIPAGSPTESRSPHFYAFVVETVQQPVAIIQEVIKSLYPIKI